MLISESITRLCNYRNFAILGKGSFGPDCLKTWKGCKASDCPKTFLFKSLSTLSHSTPTMQNPHLQ